MSLIIFHEKQEVQESLDNYLDLYYNRQMNYFASDLLEKGLSHTDLKKGISKAMMAAESAGMELRKHFQLTYTQRGGSLISDCKLSKLGYAMVLLNAPVENPVVARWQVKVLNNFL
ncbi:MAG: hypothetical protein ACI8P3_001946 [Saprospiraceae bacterium]|jgi:hypothetical protein